MNIKGEMVKGFLIERINRFEALVLIDGKEELVHVPNTGRMKEMLFKGTEVILKKSNNEKRKTKYSMFFVIKNDHLICIDSILANRVFEEAVKDGRIPWLNGDVKREVAFHDSRIDFFIEGINNTFVEVKCATYEEDGIVMFPDAPTERGRRHIDELIKALNDGYNSAIVILSFLDYVEKFIPNYKIDREFGEKLKIAKESGVIVKAYRCRIKIDEVTLDEEIPVFF